MMKNPIKTALLALTIISLVAIVAVAFAPVQTYAQTAPQCADGVDNDADGLIDLNDSGCVSTGDNSEFNQNFTLAQCADGFDNDGDGQIDLSDLGCFGSTDNSEFNQNTVTAQCNDGNDNDADGRIDLSDAGCTNSLDNSEYDFVYQQPAPIVAQCADGFDNDADGRVDMIDQGCSNSFDNSEYDNPVVAPNPINRAPICGVAQSYSVLTGQSVIFSVFATDPDGSAISYSIANLPSGATFNAGSFSWIPNQSQTGFYQLVTTATDGALSCNTTVNVNVGTTGGGFNPTYPVTPVNYNYYNSSYPVYTYQPYGSSNYNSYPSYPTNYNYGNYGNNNTGYNIGNRPPTWLTYVTNQYQTGIVGKQIYFTVLASDPDGDSISYTAINLPQGAGFDNLNRSFQWVPNLTGNFPVTFRATDSFGNSADLSITINVTTGSTGGGTVLGYYSGGPAMPYFTTTAGSYAVEGRPYAYDANAIDQDGDYLTFGLVSGPSGLTVSQYTGLVQWTPNYSQGGSSYEVVISVTDGRNIARQIFTIYVENVNGTGSVLGATTSNVEKLVISNVTATDASDVDSKVCNITVQWDTNIPSTGQVIYGFGSQADKLKDFSYDSATQETAGRFTRNQANLGCLKSGSTYYFRVVARAEGQTVHSLERILIPVDRVASKTTASVMDIFGKLLNPWFLLILILAVLAYVYYRYRREREINQPLDIPTVVAPIHENGSHH